MKKIFITTIIAFLSIASFSQKNFYKGYYIDNNGSKIECLISYNGFENNPSQIECKKTKKEIKQTLTINDIKEFGIYKNCKYIRAKVDIDYSGNKIEELSFDKTPKWKNEVVFLKVLMEGKANLYEYKNQNMFRYFYSKSDVPITQLINNNYLTDSITFRANSEYKKQLQKDLSSEKTPFNVVSNIEYTPKKLLYFFKKYNKSFSDTIVYYDKNQDIKISPQIGLNRSHIEISNFDGTKDIAEMPIKHNLQIGTEFSSSLDGKFNIFIRPTFQIYQNEIMYKWIDFQTSYATISFPIGVNYKIYQNKDFTSKIGLSYSLIFIDGGGVMVGRSGEPYNSVGNLTFDIGLNYKKYSLFYSYNTRRYLSPRSWNQIDVYYYCSALTFGYTFGK